MPTPWNPLLEAAAQIADGDAHPAPATARSIGMLGKDYEILGIKRGGMGEVYFCRAVGEGGATLALKTFPKSFFFSPETRRAFLREIVHWMRLSGLPQILPALGLLHFEGRPFVVMPHVRPGPEGLVTLHDAIRSGRASRQEKVQWALDIARGLAAAQDRIPGILHGDLKPENILLWNGRGFVSDFGLSRVQGSEGAELATTYPYRAPEVWRGAPVTPAVDIYAFGVILFELVTGRMPLDGHDRGSWEAAHLGAEPERPALADPVERHLVAVALSCVAKAPEARPRSFAEVTKTILQSIEGDPIEHLMRVVDEVDARARFAELQKMMRGWLIDTLLKLGEVELALEEVESVPEGERDGGLWIRYGDALSLAGRDEDAITSFERALDQGLDDLSRFNCMNDLALSLKRLGRVKEAEKVLDDLLSVVPDSMVVKVSANLATVHIAAQEPEKAVNILANLVRQHPGEPRAWANLGIARCMLGEHAQAVSDLRRAVALAPEMVELRVMLAATLMDRLDAFDDAATSLELALQQGAGDDLELYARLLVCYLNLRRTQDAARITVEIKARFGSEGLKQIQESLVNDGAGSEGGDTSHLPSHSPVSNEESEGSRDLHAAQDSAATPLTRRRHGWVLPVAGAAVAVVLAFVPELPALPFALIAALCMIAAVWFGRRPESRSAEASPPEVEPPRAPSDAQEQTSPPGRTSILPYMNVRMYADMRSFSLDFYDDPRRPDYVEQFLRGYRDIVRKMPAYGMNNELRATPFYFTQCARCGFHILTNRDRGYKIDCRLCDGRSQTAPAAAQHLIDLAEKVTAATGLKITDYTSAGLLLLVQVEDASVEDRVRAACEKVGFEVAPRDGFAARVLLTNARERTTLSPDRTAWIFQKRSVTKEKGYDKITPRFLDALLEELREIAPGVMTASMAIDLAYLEPDYERKLRERAEAAVEAEPYDAGHRKRLANMLRAAGDLTGAREHALAAVSLAPADADALVELAATEIAMSRFEDAASSAEKAVQLDPLHRFALAALFASSRELGREERAAWAAARLRSLGGLV
ncbi:MULTISPECIES: tetratricopeptide repeat protein [Sorangium]|uniref:Protein kinase domain-containing protein n=1 Tax=Sorangium cellulosum TaxID=56 RepID=A0A4P2QTD0_SORCE|nr:MULTISPECIES: serine/threonine-protein kinase [Sorangium]AUX33291.1 uncharacterized protein SOCE836_054460 [Sorangium cellulosum]WCQ92606.1 serine-threonine kinase [Sorangium sp. Soce836]